MESERRGAADLFTVLSNLKNTLIMHEALISSKPSYSLVSKNTAFCSTVSLGPADNL